VKNFTVIEEETFHLSGQVNPHNLRTVGSKNPFESLDHEGTIPKLTFPSLRTALRVSEGPVQKLVTKFSAAYGRHLNIDFMLLDPLMALILNFIND
jgi:hypothetical protein